MSACQPFAEVYKVNRLTHGLDRLSNMSLKYDLLGGNCPGCAPFPNGLGRGSPCCPAMRALIGDMGAMPATLMGGRMSGNAP